MASNSATATTADITTASRTRSFLSGHERTRELGLLRAIGAPRAQVRRMVRCESVITSVIGGLLGASSMRIAPSSA